MRFMLQLLEIKITIYLLRSGSFLWNYFCANKIECNFSRNLYIETGIEWHNTAFTSGHEDVTQKLSSHC